MVSRITRRPLRAAAVGGAVALLFGGLAAATAAGPAATDQDEDAFARRAVIPAPEAGFVRVGDLDGNGFVDFLGIEDVRDGTGAPVESRTGRWMQGPPEGGQPPGFNFPTQPDALAGAPRDVNTRVSIGDIDGDGHLDVLALTPEGRATAWLNTDGSAAYDRKFTVRRGMLTDADYIELADVNGDGRADLLLVRSTRDLHWYESVSETGEAEFGTQQRIALLGSGSNQVTRLDAGDINGDGRVDFVTANRERNLIAWWHQSADEVGAFDKVGEVTEREVRDLTLGDIDDDHDLDILVTAQVGSQPYHVFAWLNAGSGATFERVQAPLAGSASKNHKWSSIDAGDINNDGRIDFVATELGVGGHLCWYENPGGSAGPTPTTTAPATATNPPASPTTAATATPVTPVATATATGGGTGTPTAPPVEPTATSYWTPTPGQGVVIFLPLALRVGGYR